MAEDANQQDGWDLAVFVETHSSEVIDAYRRTLNSIDSPIAGDPAAMDQALLNAEQILVDVATTLRTGKWQPENLQLLLARDIGTARAARGIHPKDSLKAASAFFRSALSALSAHVEPDVRAVEGFTLVVLALERNIAVRIRESSESYTGFLLNKVHEAQLLERRRIARELHDRIGHGVSVVYRQLELYDLYRVTEPAKASAKVEVAQQAVQDTMRTLRSITSELRPQEPLKSMEKALLCYLDTVEADGVNVRLLVNGDETWASPEVLDESFLIIREAARNALSHGGPTTVLIRVDIAPHELRASVADDGCGFDPHVRPKSDGVGLSSMRERAELMGGAVVLTSQPLGGTQVELSVPL
ncbi:sensor histidine kinase [Microbispora sp. NPDC049125]|uniref:sensor histidine kinase n=1 Tax=Microbispora sp. NPDC049125 TaxID=3154929 RepID=UPI0034671A0E